MILMCLWTGERTGAAPQGWALHLHQTVLPVQGYIQLRPHDTTLPSFGGCPTATAGTENEPEAATMGCGGKASPSVSIFVSLRLFFTKTRVVKLRLRSPLSGTANSFTRMPKLSTFCLLTPYPCIMFTYPILTSLLSSTPPRHEYILNGTWRCHQNLPDGLSLQVYTQYPRPEVFLMTSPFSCMRLSILNYPRV